LLFMSEEKIIQHSQKAVDLLKNRSKSIKEKILEFLEEIVIIIIAVSLTLAFHNWNDRRNEREIERNFLIGTRQDLLKSAADVREGVKEYQPTVDYYDTVWGQINSQRIDAAYIDKNSGNLINTMYFGYDGSRFEGFRSSGYLRLIRNEGLLKDLMLVYSVELPFQKEADITAFHKRMEDFDQYIGTKAKIDSSGEIHVSALMDEPAVRYQIFHYRFYLHERQNQKTVLAQKLLALADEIGKELNK
jgi:hypothetical protein